MTQAEYLAEVEWAWACTGETAAAIGARLGVSKSTVIGLCYRRGWQRDPELLLGQQLRHREPIETMEDRFRRLEDNLERVLAETEGVGRVSAAEEAARPKSQRRWQ